MLSRAGTPPISVPDEPGTHGEKVAGMQGCGVSTPKAAAVAAATAGFAGDAHIPKGMILTIGILSVMVAAGWVTITFFTGRTASVDGAMPKVHII